MRWRALTHDFPLATMAAHHRHAPPIGMEVVLVNKTWAQKALKRFKPTWDGGREGEWDEWHDEVYQIKQISQNLHSKSFPYVTQTDFSPTHSSTFWVDFILRNPETGRVTNTILSGKRQGRGRKKCVCVKVSESVCECIYVKVSTVCLCVGCGCVYVF